MATSLSIKSLSSLLLLVGTSIATPLAERTTVSVKFLGNVTSSNTENIRDLGFGGCIGSVCLQSFGDTLRCGDGSAHDRYYQTAPCDLLHANSAGISGSDPLKFKDFNLDSKKNAQMFCGYFPGEIKSGEVEADYGMGITNVIAMANSKTKGILYFLKNHRINLKDNIVGAGIAIVDVSGSYPTCKRTAEYWWDSKKEPNWGDHTSLLAPDGYVYLYGGANNTLFYDGVYVARVRHENQQDLSKYQYWNGKAYTSSRLYNPSETQAVLKKEYNGQGQITWNPYLQKYLYIYTVYSYIVARTASKPEGPWSTEEFFSYAVPGSFPFIYSPTQHTEYDTSGKTVVVGYTAYPNILQAVKISFS